MLSREFHQSQMSLVQIAHRWHKRNAKLTSQLIAQFFNGVYNLQYILRRRGAVSSDSRAGVSEPHIDWGIGLSLCDFKQGLPGKLK